MVFKILLAEKTILYGNMLRRIASKTDWQIFEHPLEENLMEGVQELDPDLIIFQLDASDSRDREVYKTMREHKIFGKIPTLVLTDQPQIKTDAIHYGDAVLELPIEPEDLKSTLRRLTQKKKRILVADDEPLIRRMFKIYLEKEGYLVDTAEDGESAVKKVFETRPDLVITDIKMPHGDGYFLCRTVKESKETQHIPVIIVSALGGELDIDKGFTAGANEYLTKPVDLAELSSRIDNIFKGIELRGREKILVVNPSSIERSMLQYGLSQQGFEIIVVASAEGAEKLLFAEFPSVVIADLEIPIAELIRIRKKVKENPKSKDTPFVITTSRTAKISKADRSQLEAVAYIAKPFPMEKIVVLIERILAERRTKIEIEREYLLETIASLAQALESRDHYTRGHSDSVTKYTALIARHFFKTDEEFQEIKLAALLHDIGKIGIPDSILLKPGKLSKEEFDIIKTHPQVGADILKPIASLKDVIRMIRYHHERIDGGGYPEGLKGDDIPLGAKIIAVADTFHALISDRPYRRSMPVERALSIIREVAGVQLDERVVEIFLNLPIWKDLVEKKESRGEEETAGDIP
jgi:putative nucleotidyltransferase with HDIG domain